ncbi:MULTISPECIES: ABC transporter permease [unclassified Streptomyces]|uniref:ABC transporter permease n=1 Tax=unclassified Streptomyces TaxID=2593676 RepID=UPI0022584787|nr:MULTISPECIES: ABC transporter permease [unclassified Streptomyces]WSP56744.1 ABC transporter permease [Streptomyces sp. NBC_01241]WSU22538.1 ABC transporter permease [Streptomyces sp. NBC_01108]MCX4788499.1 ABC transporter permease [Streptomyces sp. NBC_01221]WSJ37029.1 ABC transporter permease [Streptomyces sp. NBC_01321]WSP63429.1 ABC transporter permease [Streptomyces sp. NBC_01240]
MSVLSRFGRSTEMTLLTIGVLGFALLAIDSHGDLLQGSSIRNVLVYLTVPLLIGLAQLVVMAAGQMNLSVGALGGFLAVLTASLMADHGVPAPLAVLIAVASGALVGALNGALVVATRINGFIVTLATMTILLGVQYRLVGTRTINVDSAGLRRLGTAAVLNIPVILVIALAVAGALAFFLRRAVAGRRLLASGGNPLAAQLSGISNDRALILAHTLSGLIIGIAAVVTVASAPGVNKSIGGDWILPSFAAPIIGGAVLAGGAVSVLGTVLAAFIVRTVDIARAQFSLDPSWVNFTVGAVVLGTVVIGRIRETRHTSGRGNRSTA